MNGKKVIILFLTVLMLLPLGTAAESTEEPLAANIGAAGETSETAESIEEPAEIVTRNKDILEAVYASCSYGVHTRGVENYKKRLSLLITTDIHGAWARLDEAVKYLNAIPSLDGGVCLGDIINGDSFEEDSEAYNAAVAASSKPWFTVIGNHDCGNSHDPALCGTTKQVVEKYITPNESRAGQEGLTVPYYFYDWENYGIRMIVLYNYESPLTMQDEAYIIRHGDECYDQDQIDWLIDTLYSTPPEYSVVILQHSQPEANYYMESNFSQPYTNHRANGSGCYNRAAIKGDIVDAWIHGTALTKSYEPEEQYSEILPVIKVSADFTERGPGEFICYLVGHEHTDTVSRLAEHPEQITISFAATSAGVWVNGGSDLPRVKGERSEDAITVVSFETGYRTINLVRVGSNKTIHMIDRTMTAIPYMNLGGY